MKATELRAHEGIPSATGVDLLACCAGCGAIFTVTQVDPARGKVEADSWVEQQRGSKMLHRPCSLPLRFWKG